jgi:hypothetical protein
MRTLALSFWAAPCCTLLAAALQIPSNAPVYRAIQKHERRLEAQTTAPPVRIRRKPNLTQAKQHADELAKLAQSIPMGIGQVEKGVLPKDLGQTLKKIEKLSKQLRSELVL